MKHVLFSVALAAATFVAVDATGTWTGTLTPSDRQAGPARLVLKQEGDKLTGTAGPSESEQHTIEKGKAENGTLTFQLTTPGGVMKFTLTQDGDQITGDVTREREGQTQTAKIALKRAE